MMLLLQVCFVLFGVLVCVVTGWFDVINCLFEFLREVLWCCLISCDSL